ncbi:MAG: hypothetical protein K0R10_2258, partial [Alphaproteobacteria bacterium]|nr:hypothetical protein [Alphaproteobacteria bacterium]
KEPKDEEKLAALQKRLLENAAFMLKPGGVLIYCTCSLQKAEGENQGAWALRKQFGLQPLPITEKDLPGIAEMITPQGELRCLPQHWAGQGGIDGFYIARFVKV